MLEPRYEPTRADSAQSPLSTRREATPFTFIGERLWLDFVNTDDLRRGVRFDALREFGFLRGTILAAWRLLRCNPWSHGGVDYAHDQRVFPIQRRSA